MGAKGDRVVKKSPSGSRKQSEVRVDPNASRAGHKAGLVSQGLQLRRGLQGAEKGRGCWKGRGKLAGGGALFKVDRRGQSQPGE